MRGWLAALGLAAMLAAPATAARAADEPLRSVSTKTCRRSRRITAASRTRASTCCWRRRSPTGSDARSKSSGSKASWMRIRARQLEANALLSDGRCSLSAATR